MPPTPDNDREPATLEPQTTAEPMDSAATLVRRTIIGIAILMLVAGLAGLLLREEIETLGAGLVARWGLGGLFASVLVVDWSPLPLTHEPLLLLAVAGGVGPWTVFVVAALASVCSGFVGYGCGVALDGATGWRERFLSRGSRRIEHVRRWGAVGVAIAALTPIPYALGTWTAGVLRVPLKGFVLACLLRIPKTGFYLWLLLVVWRSVAPAS